MNNNDLHKIFNSTICISTEKMIKYQEGKLPEMEKNSVEKHLASCNMCHDEFEGLLLIPIKSSLPETVFELNSKVDSIIANTHKRIPFLMPINLMAAIILFIIGFAWYATYYIHSLSRLNNEQVSQSVYVGKDRGEIIIVRPAPSLTESEKSLTKRYDDRIENRSELKLEETKSREINENPISSDKIINDSEIINKESNNNAVNSDNINAGNTVGETNTIADNKTKTLNEDVNKNIQDENTKSTESEENNIALAEKDIQLKSDKSNKSNRSSLNKTKKSEVSSNTESANNFNLAKTAYNKKDYQTAIALFKQCTNNNDEVHFYLAMSYANIHLPEQALTEYNSIISNKQSTFFEQALWNKSQILIKLDKQKSAINTLNQIKNLKGIYSKQAEIMLDSLNLK